MTTFTLDEHERWMLAEMVSLLSTSIGEGIASAAELNADAMDEAIADAQTFARIRRAAEEGRIQVDDRIVAAVDEYRAGTLKEVEYAHKCRRRFRGGDDDWGHEGLDREGSERMYSREIDERLGEAAGYANLLSRFDGCGVPA